MKKLLSIIISVLLFGCVSEYIPKGVNEARDVLVIEGFVTNGESVFKLSRSVGLLDDLRNSNNHVNDAAVYVEKESGEQIQGFLSANGTYTVVTGELDAETKYRFYAVVGGEEYRSEFLAPIFTSKIDSINYIKESRGEPVSIHVSTRDLKEQSRYYLWSYQEHWEVKAELFANYGLYDGVFGNFSLMTSRNTYYCWRNDSSITMHLASTEKLSENFINQKKLKEIPSHDSRLSVLYYIKVKQMQIRREAYDCFYNIQKNIEQMGGIFSPMPSEVRGNIICSTNPDLPVIGYVDVTTTATEEMFINGSGLYEPKYNNDDCGSRITAEPEYAYPRYAFYSFRPLVYAPHTCVDCRTIPGATKNRPDFWPNEHY